MVNYFKVGGYVRDSLLGIKSKDVDFAVEAESYSAMREDLINKGVTIWLETPEFYTIRGSHPTYGGVDYVLCRKESDYKDGRHPETVEAGTLLDDLARRDFTINAMALDENENVVDPFGGQADLKNKIIRCVGSPYLRFEEDSLRILRAIRFAIKLGFQIEENTFRAMEKESSGIAWLPEDRIRDELEKCFRYSTVLTLQALDALNLTELIFGSKYNLWLRPTSKER